MATSPARRSLLRRSLLGWSPEPPSCSVGSRRGRRVIRTRRCIGSTDRPTAKARLSPTPAPRTTGPCGVIPPAGQPAARSSDGGPLPSPRPLSPQVPLAGRAAPAAQPASRSSSDMFEPALWKEFAAGFSLGKAPAAAPQTTPQAARTLAGTFQQASLRDSDAASLTDTFANSFSVRDGAPAAAKTPTAAAATAQPAGACPTPPPPAHGAGFTFGGALPSCACQEEPAPAACRGARALRWRLSALAARDAGGNASAAAATAAMFTPPVSMFTPGNTPATATARRTGRRGAAQARGAAASAMTGGFQRHGQRGFSFKTPAPAAADEAPPGTPMDISPMDCSPFPPQAATSDLQYMLQSAQRELDSAYDAPAEAEPAETSHASARPTGDGNQAAPTPDREATSASAAAVSDSAAAVPRQTGSTVSSSAAAEGGMDASQQHSGAGGGARGADGPQVRGHGGAADSAAAAAPVSPAVGVSAQQAANAVAPEAAHARTLFPETLAEAFGAKLHVSGEDAPGGRTAQEAATKSEQPISFSFGAAAPSNPFSAHAQSKAAAAGGETAHVSPSFPGWFQQAASANGDVADRAKSGTAASARTAVPTPVFGGFTGAGGKGSANRAAPVFGAAGWPQPAPSSKPPPARTVGGSASGAASVFGGTRWSAATAAAPQGASAMDSSEDSDGDEETSTMRVPRPTADSQPSKRQQRTPRKAVRPRATRAAAPKHHRAGGGVPLQEAAANGVAHSHSSPSGLRTRADAERAKSQAAAAYADMHSPAGSTKAPASGAANGRHPAAAAPADVRMPDHLLRARPRGSPARPSPAQKAMPDAGNANGHIGSSPKAAMLRYCDGKARSAFQAGRYDEAAQHYSEVHCAAFRFPACSQLNFLSVHRISHRHCKRG